MSLLSLDVFYVVAGLFLLSVSVHTGLDAAHPRRWGSALFWSLLAVTFVAGQIIPSVVTGYLVLAMVVLAATGQVAGLPGRGEDAAARAQAAERLGDFIFLPALLIPGTAVVGTLLLGRLHWGDWHLIDPNPNTITVTSVCLGAVVAVVAALRVTGAPASAPVTEGSRMVQTVGWALILPQMLAALGGLFAKAQVGQVVADLVARTLPTGNPFVAVAAYCLGMALFTMCMGNAFAAFPVITLGIGLPFIVQLHHGNVAIMAAIGMLSGYCGTLMTPMAANFNIVPVMLLDLHDRHAVIRAQIPLGITILLANILLLYLCVYRF